jgi:hypothetical protein
VAAQNGALIVHRSPGRMRLRVPALREEPELAARIEARLGALPGIRELRANATTGSLLILHDGEAFDEAGWTEAASAEGLFQLSADPPAAPAPDRPRGTAAWAAWDQANTAVNRVSRNLLDLRTLIPLCLALWSLRQILTERPLARTPWYTLLWYAFGIFTRFNPPPK